MTVEGAVNLLGILVLGQDDFYDSLERKPVRDKLSQLLSALGKTDESVQSQLLDLAGILSKPRNAFVHPKPIEGQPQPRQGRGPNLADARKAVDEATRFLGLLQQVSYRYRPFFHVWQ